MTLKSSSLGFSVKITRKLVKTEYKNSKYFDHKSAEVQKVLAEKANFEKEHTL